MTTAIVLKAVAITMALVPANLDTLEWNVRIVIMDTYFWMILMVTKFVRVSYKCKVHRYDPKVKMKFSCMNIINTLGSISDLENILHRINYKLF